MSEHSPSQPEKKIETLKELSKDLEARPALAERATPDNPEKRAETIRAASEQAKQAAEIENPLEAFVADQAAQAAPQQTFVDSTLKKLRRKREMQHIQRQLPKSARAFSKVVHQPVVRVVSEGASKTVTRPSGLLGGGIVAFIGTSVYVYFTKHIGLPYNYLLFALFFVGGFAIGLSLELAIWLMNSHKATTDS